MAANAPVIRTDAAASSLIARQHSFGCGFAALLGFLFPTVHTRRVQDKAVESRHNQPQSKGSMMRSGDRLGSLEIIALIGAGGMGEVYEARDLRLGRRVALKILAEKLSADSTAAAEFEREARAVAALSHPNILAIHEFDRDGEVAYTVTELLEGETLRKAMGHRRMSWRKVAEIGVALCDGLAAAHAKGIVHRDLKPENVFITSDGVVKILDFGLAVPVLTPHAESDAITKTSPRVAGTVGYMSPEQLRGEPTDARSDIFALGCVLYEMLAGVTPFASPTYVEAVTAALHDEPAHLLARGVDAPPTMIGAIERCLEKHEEQRFQSARDLRFALHSSMTSAERIGAEKRARGRLFAALGAIVMAAGIGGVAIHRGMPEPPPGGPSLSSIVVLPFDNLSRDESQEYFSAGMTDALISDLAQIGSLRVISRTTSIQYKSAKKTIPEIARELDVAGVVEGTVLRSGNRVRITAQLIDAGTDRHLWSHTYEQDLTDILQLQKQLARDIAGRIRVQLTSDERRQLSRTGNVDPAAYDLYLRGLHDLRTMSFTAATRYFLQSIETDPNFAPAHAGLADAYAAMQFFGDKGAQEWADAARAAARRAIALDENAPEGHLALAHVEGGFLWDMDTYKREVERALSLSPSDAAAHRAYADYFVVSGDMRRALAELRKVTELDPQSAKAFNSVSEACYAIGDYDCAIAWAKRALTRPEVFFDHQVSQTLIGRSLARLGRHNEALTVINGLPEGDRRNLDLLLIYTLAGRTADAQRCLALTEKDQDPFRRAEAHAIVGDNDAAIEDLKPLIESRAGAFLSVYSASAPEYASLRMDPRIQEMFKRAGLPLPPQPR